MNARTPFIALAVLLAPIVAIAEDTGEQWEVTTKMEMQGMPMAMPAMTNTVCLPKKRQSDEDLVPRDKNSDCKMSDVKQSGNKMSFKMACSGKNAMTGEGEIEHNADNYRGKMHMVGDMDGQQVDMTQNFSGKRIGTCAYEDPGKKYAAMQQKYTDEMCRQSIDRLEWRVFSDDPQWAQQFAVCKPYKKEFCARVTKIAGDMRALDGFKNFTDEHKDWKDLFATCGIDSDKLLVDICRKATDAKDWEVVVNYCPGEAKAAAAEHCAGRDYTAMMVGPYGALCQRYAKRPAPNMAPETAPTKEDLIKQGVDEGVNKLKKLLPF